MATSVTREYGMSSDLFVTRRAGTDSYVLSGTGTGANRWARVLTSRALHLLWYRLTWSLFPEKSLKVTGMAATAPLRSTTAPKITTHIEVIYHTDIKQFDVIGTSGEDRWQFRIDHQTARILWTALDLILYPAGWQGANTVINKAP